jgi:hypothetical protein
MCQYVFESAQTDNAKPTQKVRAAKNGTESTGGGSMKVEFTKAELSVRSWKYITEEEREMTDLERSNLVFPCCSKT